MNIKEIPIAVPTIIPTINPISKSELSLDCDNNSFSEITIGGFSGSVNFVEFFESITIDSDGRIISELEIISDERLVNFV